MKLGQVMSFLDVGLVPEEHREEFQRELAKLRDAAPTVSFKQMRQVIEDDLEEPIDGDLRRAQRGADRGRLDRAGLSRAAARGRHGGRRQGPVPRRRRRGPRRPAEPGHHHARAQADDAGDGRQGRSPARSASGSGRSSTTSSRPRTSARSRASTRAHPFIVVPRVVSSLHAQPVMVSEFVDGVRLRGAARSRPSRSATESARSSSASSSAACTATASSPVTRIPATSCCSPTAAWRSLTSACSSAWTPPRCELELDAQRAVVEDDAATLHDLLAESGFLPEPERVDPEHLLTSCATRSGGTRRPTKRSS